VPVIDGCTEQWYVYVPGFAKVKEYDWPVARSELAGPPLSPVTVCATLSLLVQVTVVPTATVTLLGAN
jgi:hypothetical protein